MTEEIREVLAFWFGPLDEAGMPAEDRNPLWFKTSDETDRLCADRFGSLVDQVFTDLRSAIIEGELEPGSRLGIKALFSKFRDLFARNSAEN